MILNAGNKSTIIQFGRGTGTEPASCFPQRSLWGDAELRREVESLLAVHEGAGNFLDKPAMEEVAQVLAKGQAQSLVGRQIGSYKILSLLGSGGMGQVYRARDAKLGVRLRLKSYRESFPPTQNEFRRFGRRRVLRLP